MGDVAMTIPVLRQVLESYPEVQLDVLTRSAFQPLFFDHPRLRFIHPDLQGAHKGIFGLFTLFKELIKNNYTAIADLHDVLRSQIIRNLFRISGVMVRSLNKGRSEKAALVRRHHKKLRPLTSMHDRYAQVFHALGYPVPLNPAFIKFNAQPVKKIGVAPFAAHKEKMWPLDKSIKLITQLQEKYNCQIFLYGGGPHESDLLNEISKELPDVISTANFSLNHQRESMQSLDLMITMDSANMHIASNENVPVISIWGATHPYAGFLGFGQRMEYCIQRHDLDCRPCSVFGNKTCWRGDWACLDISVDEVLGKVKQVIASH